MRSALDTPLLRQCLGATNGDKLRSEGTRSQGVRAFDLRQARYVGLASTPLQHILSAVGVYQVQVGAWMTLETQPRSRHGSLSKSWLRVFRSANTAHLGH